MTTDDRILPPNVNEYYGIESINGYDPIHSARYEQFVAAMERGKPNINPPFGFDRIIVPKNFQSPLFKLLNVRYILSFAEIKDPEFRLVTSEGMTKVYEYSAATPRAYLVSRVQYKANSQDIINALYSNDFHYQTDAVVEQPVKVLNFDLETSESATIKEYSSDHMIIHTVTAQPRFMVLDTVFDPHEKVTINGKIVSKYRVNYLFTGVVVPSGNADVTLQHE